jgi:outer membrane protein assembly factor BamB
MTGSPVVAGDRVFTRVSASGAGGPNATFRGAIVALDAQTGEIVWRSYSLPDNEGVPGGYAGATMFSPPAVDLDAGLRSASPTASSTPLQPGDREWHGVLGNRLLALWH